MSLRSLRTAIGEWAPAAGRPPEPLAAAIAAWPSIVGRAIAEQTRPAELARDTLVIVTRSSAWSQQLSFLSEDVLRGLHAVAELRGVARLRFRVGRIRLPGAGLGLSRASPVRRRAPARAPLPADAPVGAVIALVREHLAALRHGEATCRVCGAVRDEPGVCAPCAAGPSTERMMLTQRLMYDAPWLGYAGMSALVPGLRSEEFERWRRALLARWWEILVRARWAKRVTRLERRVASSYVLLHSRLEPDHVTPAVVRNLLGDEIAAMLDDATSANLARAGSPKGAGRRSVPADE